MMRVYIISAVYPPEALTSARTSSDIAEEMALRGHEVTVFAAFPNRPAGSVMRGYRRSLRHIEHRDGYRIVHTWHSLSKRSTLISRLAENVSFGISSTLQLLGEATPDVVFLNTWPIFAQWTNTALLFRRGVPIVCAVKDLFPESFFDSGRLAQKNPIIRAARAVDAQIYRRSSIVAPLNPIMAEHITTSRKVPPSKIRVLSDWVDASHFPKDQLRTGSFREKLGIAADLFLAMYVGSVTRMAGLGLYIEAAERLRHRTDIRILLVGDGAVREQLEMAIRQKGLENIEIIYPLKSEDVPAVQAAADVLILSLLPGAAAHATPSKLIFYMCSQRPILASVHPASSPARIIRDAACGYVIHQGDPAELARRLARMADDRRELQRLGDNARRYAEEHFLKENALPSICDLLEQLGASGDSVSGSIPLGRQRLRRERKSGRKPENQLAVSRAKSSAYSCIFRPSGVKKVLRSEKPLCV